jgi:hypothetical protein
MQELEVVKSGSINGKGLILFAIAFIPMMLQWESVNIRPIPRDVRF